MQEYQKSAFYHLSSRDRLNRDNARSPQLVALQTVSIFLSQRAPIIVESAVLTVETNRLAFQRVFVNKWWRLAHFSPNRGF